MVFVFSQGLLYILFQW